MATMPDMNLDEVGVMAYWNITDDGHDPETVDWGEMASAFDEYTIYDNGIVGTVEDYDDSQGELSDFTIRAKSDGWVVSYVGPERSEESALGSWDWKAFHRPDDTGSLKTVDDDSNLHNVMRDATSELSENPTILSEDLKYYSPLHDPATTCSIAGCRGESSDDADWLRFTITEGITIEDAHFLCGRWSNNRFYLHDITNNQQLYYFDDSDSSSPDAAIVTDDLTPGHQYEIEVEPTSSSGVGEGFVRLWWW